IEAKPKTGRTHQIRVHLASIGCSILGDSHYGDLSPQDRARPMMLHARRIVLPLSANKPPVIVEAAPPPEMTALIDQLHTS
ncbi:MAG: RNA pseudouridine synthase, partial [Parvularculaceae bacterium]|nr:RNA pseudouridine synthase [Parvularculaceae bacterium]